MIYEDSENFDNFSDLPAACVLIDGIMQMTKVLANTDCIKASRSDSKSLDAFVEILSGIKYALLYEPILPF